MNLDLKAAIFYTPEEVAAIFRHEGDKRWAYRHATARGFLRPAARRFGRTLLFLRAEVDRLVNPTH